jgi:hypothetical protein
MAKARRPKKKVGGPYLDAALICEDLVQEKDLAVSAIRAVNRITLHEVTPQPDPGTVFRLPLMLVVSFKAGNVVGEKGLRLYLTGPSGKRCQMPVIVQPHTLSFQGGDTGCLAFVPVFLQYEQDGTYWIDVVLDRTRYSRVPLTFRID